MKQEFANVVQLHNVEDAPLSCPDSGKRYHKKQILNDETVGIVCRFPKITGNDILSKSYFHVNYPHLFPSGGQPPAYRSKR